MRGFVDLLKRFRADERGVFAVIFGLMAIVLVAMAGAAVDYTSLETARNRAQIAMDSAALGLAPKIYDNTEDELKLTAEALVLERLNDPTLTMSVDSAEATKANGTLRLEGTLTVPMAFVQLVGISSLTAKVASEATRGSVNLEVAVALDTTGSMGTQGIEDLQSALATLIPLVVHDTQEPTYSKMALVPYAATVNVGDKYAEKARGPLKGAKSISSAAWWDVEKDISGATKARPVVITQNAHGFANDDMIYITGVKGMTELNGKAYIVKNRTANTFELYTTGGSRVDGRSYSTYQTSTADKMKRCILQNCNIVVTVNSHGYATDEFVRITGITSGMTGLNNKNHQITRLSDNTFSVPVVGYGTSYVQPVATGSTWCLRYGCELYKIGSGSTIYKSTPSCVTERMTNSFNDVAPSTTYLSAHYTSSGSCQMTHEILPLTSDKDKLLAYTASGALTARGYTAGQLGTAWAWYLVSPNFAELFPSGNESRPATYDAPNTLKIAIIMTDGEYNTEYCWGVDTDNVSCGAPDGTTGTMSGALGQAEDLCYEMKQNKIVIYTVGFNLGSSGNAVDLLTACASDPSKAFRAENGDELEQAFRKIGENISDLRLSR